MNYLARLRAAAKSGKWDYVDSIIPEISGDMGYAKWAYAEGINDPDKNIRDLAVSVIEKSEIPKAEFEKMRDRLYELMNGDKNPYVQFRSAFALAHHGPGKHKKKVIEKLHEAEKDKDVSEIARYYLMEMEK